MTSADYARYSITEFLEDDYFLQWATARDERNDSFWKAFLAEYPGKEAVVREALTIVQVYRAQDTFGNDRRIDAVWNRIDASIACQPIVATAGRMWWYAKVAASVLLVCCAAVSIWYYTRDQMTTVTTAYGEVKAVTLPDQSIVMLNGNSVLTYREHWSPTEAREVWIRGEAYFDVRHTNIDTANIRAAERFFVHGKDMDIEVLGTSFNVKSRRNKTNIALLTGKIEVTYRDASVPSAGLVMLPGDYVEYAGHQLLTKRKLLRPHKVATWTVREITFTDPSIGEIVETLQDNYGYAVNLGDKELLELRIEGEISVTSVPELLAVVSSTLGIRIEESGKEIIIMRK
ncbi:MAG TPA: FecR domain-containing protein [Chryseolinea sp.]|nr:FecR domain-containing protein [Chryseolinea sp.]